MHKWAARLAYALRRHGPVGFIRLAAYNVVYHVFRRNPRPDGLRHPDSFDARYGTDTGGIREIGSLDIVNSPTARHAVRYDPSGAEWVHARIANLPIEYSNFTFIDYGSGKGRVLLVAAGFAFKEVIGIEFSRELHNIALKNIARFPAQAVHAGRVHSICGDVTAFEPPQSDLVCYFYNPFAAPIVSAVAARLVALHERHGCRIIIIYLDPRYPEVFEGTGRFVVLDETPEALVFATPAGPAAAHAGFGGGSKSAAG